MSKSRNTVAAIPHWHLDCRIESELPEDNLVGTRFLINVLFGAVALAALLFAGWLGYLDLSTRHQIRDWEQRINDNRAEVRDIQRMQREYSAEATKIDEAFKLIRPQLHVYDFLLNLGRTRPTQLVIDSIDWNDNGITVHGNLHENPERSSLLIGNFVKTLSKDEKMSAIFREIVLKAVDRGTTNDAFTFEIVFYLKPPKA